MIEQRYAVQCISSSRRRGGRGRMSCMKMRLPGGTGQNSGRSANFVASKLFSQHSIPHNKVLLVSSSKGIYILYLEASSVLECSLCLFSFLFHSERSMVR